MAGQGGSTGGYSGDGSAATGASLWGPAGLLFDSSGNLYIADSDNQVIRQVNSGGTISTFAGTCSATPCAGAFAGDKSAANKASLNGPSGMAFDSSGNLYIADTGNYEVRRIAGGTISTFAGQNSKGAGFGGDLGAATSAQLWDPSGVAVDSAGNVYIADPYNNVVRVVCQTQTPIACTNNAFVSSTGYVQWAAGDINTFAGRDVNTCTAPVACGAGYAGDGGLATGSLLNNPAAVFLDGAGNLYISDSGNNVIRMVDTNGIITTVAGNGEAGYSGDGGTAVNAALNNPKGIAVDSAGNLYIADTVNSVIRVVVPANGSLANGTIYTIAGNNVPGFSGDNGSATAAQLNFPAAVTLNGGKIYVADTGNNAVRVLTAAPQLPTVNANGVITAGSFGASATVAAGSWIEIYGQNLASTTRTWGTADFTGSNAPTSLSGTSVTIGDQSAFVAYVSGTQVNVQVPSGLAAGTQPLVVKTASGSTAAYNLTIGTAPGIYAPAILNIGGKQYAGALLANSSTWVLPTGAVSGLTSQPASPGQTITLYGVGFGGVTPTVPAGQLVGASELTSLTQPVQILFGNTPATISYQGLAPGLVGLYQFNVVVPDVPAAGAVPLTFMQGGFTLPQTLYTAVGN